MKVLLFSPLPPPRGGIGTWTTVVLDELRKSAGVEARLVDSAVRWRPPSGASPAFRVLGGAAQAGRDILRVAARFVSWRPSVLHLCTSAGDASLKDLVLVKTAGLFRVPVVLHYHTSRLLQDSARGSRPWRLAKRSIMKADAVIVIEPESEKLLLSECPRAHLVRFPNPIRLTDIKEAAGPGPSPLFSVAFAAAAVLQKGIDVAVEACLDLPGTILWVAGPVDPKLKTTLEGRARGRDGGSWLRFLGELPREKALGVMASSDLVILPSRKVYEAFPYVVLEAMALGRPVLATRVGAVSEMLDVGTDHPCGVVVTPGNPAELKEAMARLRQETSLRQKMGENGRRRVSAVYAAPVVVGQLTRLWEAITKARAEPRRGESRLN